MTIQTDSMPGYRELRKGVTCYMTNRGVTQELNEYTDRQYTWVEGAGERYWLLYDR